jgi:ribosomal-protein-alanine N-acetyltransferase
MRQAKPLETKRLILRKVTAADAGGLFETMSDPRVAQFTDFVAHTDISQTQKQIQAIEAWYASSNFLYWVVLKETQLIGYVGAPYIDTQNNSVEFGYGFAHSAWGNGYASEAASAVIQYLLTECGFHRVSATVAAPNIASRRVLEKCGMRQEGKCIQSFKLNTGDFVDDYRYAILVQERKDAGI